MDETTTTDNPIPANYSHINFTLDGQTYSVHTLDGVEELGQPFYFNLELLAHFNLQHLLSFSNKPAKLTLIAADGRERIIVGMITHIQQLGDYKDGQQYFRFRLESRLALLKKSMGPRLFINKSINEIITELLLEIGYEPNEIIWHLTIPLSPRPQTMQLPNESNFHFIVRLFAKEGLFYLSACRAEREIIYFFANNEPLDHFGVITFIKPSSFVASDQSAFYFLEAHYKLTPNTFVVSDYNIQTPMQVIQAATNTNTKLATNPPCVSHHFGVSALTQEEAEKQAKFRADTACAQSFYLLGSGYLPLLSVGKKISLDANAFNPIYSNDYLVLKLGHFARQATGHHGEGTSIPYQQLSTLLPIQIPFHCANQSTENIPLLTAHIYSPFDNGLPFLDEQGRYSVQYHFDRLKQTTPPIVRLTPHTGKPTSNGNNSGFHTPINAGAEVLVSSCFDDVDQPCIIGTLPHAKTKSPVTAKNNSQHWFRTPAQNQFLMAVYPSESQIKLANPNDQNQLCLTENAVKLSSQKGNINLTAKQAINLISGKDTSEINQGNYSQTIGQNYSVAIGNDGYQEAAQNQLLQAKQTLHINAGRHCLLNSGQKLDIKASNDIMIKAAGNHCSFNSGTGEFSFNCGAEMIIEGTGEGSIEIGQLDVGIILKSDGTIEIFGEQVNLIGKTVIIVKGQLL